MNPESPITFRFIRFGYARRLVASFYFCIALFSLACAAQPLQVDYRCDEARIFEQGQARVDGWLAADNNAITIPKGGRVCWARIRIEPVHGTALALSSQRQNIQLFDAQQEPIAAVDRYGTSINAFVGINRVLFRDLGAGQTTVYARMEQDPYYGYDRAVDVALVDFSSAMEQERRLETFQIITLTALAMIALIAVIFSFAVRDSNYALFALYSLCVAAISAYQLTLPQQFSHSALFSWLWFCCMFPLANFLGLIVIIKIGQFKYHSRLIKVMLQWMAYSYLLLMPVWFFAATAADHANSVLNLLSFPLLLVAFWRGMRRANVYCLLLLIGSIPNMIVGIPGFLSELTGVNWTPAFIAESNWLEFGSNVLLPLMFLGILALRSLSFRRKSVYLRLHDPVTGLPNRAYLQQLDLAQISKSHDLVVLVINIKRFRAINEALGAGTGDQLLAEVARRLKLAHPSHIARLHADQFCLLTSHAGLAATLAQLKQAFSYPAQVNGQIVDLAIAIGSAGEGGLNAHNEGGERLSVNQLVRNAEIALDVARTNRINLVEYDKVQESTRQQDLGLMSEMNQAIANREFRLVLQPKIRMQDCALISVEALIRWDHPTRGLINPEYFIPFAEVTGCIRMITQWVLSEAMELSARMRANNNPIQIAVNLSALDLADDELLTLLKTLLQKQHARAEDIRLEITEHSAMSNPAASLEVMHSLRNLGFSLSIDDFGTGYSSLSYLQKIPLSELKIDRGFISKAISRDAPNILLKSIIRLGHQLGLSVVAEGVETREEWEVLAALECDFVQGFFVAEAMSVEKFEDWRASGQNLKIIG